MSNILLHGHYTLMICVVGVVLVMAFGHNTLADNVRLIPVYTMGSSFLTAAWPSLEHSWASIWSNSYQRLPVQEASSYPATPTVPMSAVQFDPQGPLTPTAPAPDWLVDQSRQGSSPSPASRPPSLGGEGPSPGQGPVAAWFQHMGPVSDRRPSQAHTDTSISLSSRQTVPSEVSTNALELLLRPGEPARLPRTTQRRRDISNLGRAFPPREESSPPVRVADGSYASSTQPARGGDVGDSD